jgi:Domain of unknown function (DUF4214)
MNAPLFQPFIATALRRITEQLNASDGNAEQQLLPDPQQVLDTSMAEPVAGGSMVFPDTGGEFETDWCVLTFLFDGPSHNSETYRFRGRIRADAKPVEFVERAYDLILRRQADDEGRGIYTDLLEKFMLSKREVLKILAESPEARNLATKLIVVPDPSSWISKAGVTSNSDSEFPDLTIIG